MPPTPTPAPTFPVSKPIRVVNNVPIQRGVGEAAFFFECGMNVDVDGAPNAYHPATAQSHFGCPPALDDLRNAGVPGGAGQPGRWWGLAIQPNGFPCVQGEGDPEPGFYVSTTSLVDGRYGRECDQRRYVDARQVPYVALPPEVVITGRSRVGDFAAVQNRKSGQTAFAIFADVGPRGKIGEGSIALAQALGLPVRRTPVGVRGGQDEAIFYIVFAGSGKPHPRSADEINVFGARLFDAWGGVARIKSLFPDMAP